MNFVKREPRTNDVQCLFILMTELSIREMEHSLLYQMLAVFVFFNTSRASVIRIVMFSCGQSEDGKYYANDVFDIWHNSEELKFIHPHIYLMRCVCLGDAKYNFVTTNLWGNAFKDQPQAALTMQVIG